MQKRNQFSSVALIVAIATCGCEAAGPATAGSGVLAEDANQTGTGTGSTIIESDVIIASSHDVQTVNPDGGAVTGPVVNPDIGLSCSITGACPVNMACIGGVTKDSPLVYCTADCESDANCPATFECAKQGKDPKGVERSLCERRVFCSNCTTDNQCGDGARCVSMGGAKFCSRTCNIGKTECPRWATCEEVSEGGAACVHNSGSCQGDGSLCAACAAADNCTTNNGACLTYNHTKEQFCSAPCNAGGSCATGFNCVDINMNGAKSKQCVPADKTAPKCVPKLSKHIEEGDILDDFVMTGYIDTDDNGSLLSTVNGDEQPRVIKLSEFADLGYKIVLFNVAAGWCGPCKQETLAFKALIAKYPGLGIYQVIYDGVTPGSLPQLPLAKSWIKDFKGVGAVGVDPDRNVSPINVAGSTPLNLIIDAKTRKVLKKMNGLPQTGIGGVVAPFMK